MNDTIAAISSSGGPIGLIRVSGERAIEAINAVFQAKNGKPLTEAPSQKLVYGTLTDKSGNVIDCCYAVALHAPHTYTGETMAEASASSLILAVFDGSKPISDEDMLVLARSAGHRAIAVVNKVDLPQQLDEKLLKKHFLHIVPLSAKTGDGLDKLLNLIPRTVGLGDGAFDGALITNARQAAALARAAERCEAALYAAQSGMTPDAVVMDAEGAITALGEITGETVTDAVVTRIFSDFCVGK